MIALADGVDKVRIHENVNLDVGSPNVRVDVLDYSGTTSGTHKSIKAREVLRRAPSAEAYIAITSGNYGIALKQAAEEMGVNVILAVKPQIEGIVSLEGTNSRIVCVDCLQRCLGAYTGAPPHRMFPQLMGYPDLRGDRLPTAYKSHQWVNNLEFEQTVQNITGFGDIVRDPLEAEPLYTAPRQLLCYDKVFVPTGSGELLFDLARQGAGKFYGVIPKGHPLLTGIDFDENVGTSHADKLVTPTLPMRSALSQLPNIYVVEADEPEFLQGQSLATKAGFDSEVSGAAAFTLGISHFRERNKLEISPRETVLIVNTGKGPFSS